MYIIPSDSFLGGSVLLFFLSNYLMVRGFQNLS